MSNAAPRIVASTLLALVLAAPASARASPNVVTLITGDRVLVDTGPDGRPIVGIDPASREPGTTFQTLSIGAHLYVVPATAAGYVGAPLDLSLFDVSALAALDPAAPLALEVTSSGSAATVPGLISTGPGKAMFSRGKAAEFGSALAADASGHKQGKASTLFAGIDRIALAGASTTVPPGQPADKLYTLTVKGFDRHGQRVFGSFGIVYDVDDGNVYFAAQAFWDGTASFSVPAGNYQVSALIFGADFSNALVTREVSVRTSNTIVTLDAKKSVPLGATAPEPTTVAIEEMTLQRNAAQGLPFTNSVFAVGPWGFYVSPSPAVTLGQQHFFSHFVLGDAAGSLADHLFDLRFDWVGGIPNDVSPVVAWADLAVRDATYHSSSPGRLQLDSRLARAPWEPLTVFTFTSLTAPLHRTEYVLPSREAQWTQLIVADANEFAGIAQDGFWAPAPGDRLMVDWTAQPEPAGILQPELPQGCPACRAGDTLATVLFPYVDPAGHAMLEDSSVSTTLSLYLDGKLLDQKKTALAQFALSPDPATYQLVMDVSRDRGFWPSSTRSHTVWTFASMERPADKLPPGWICSSKGGGGGGGRGVTTDGKGGGGGGGGGGTPDGCSYEPLLFASYDSHAGKDDVVPAGRDAVVDVSLHRIAFMPAPEIASFTLDVSFDDGASWTAATVTALGDGRFRASYPQPQLEATTGFASLRLSAADTEGNGLEQILTRAYPLAVPPAPAPGDGGGGRKLAAPCTMAVAAPYAQCMARLAPDALDAAPRFRGYGPADLASAYRLPAGAGAGRTVAIVDAYDDPNAEADLAVYRARFGLPPCTTANGCFRKVNQRGAEGPLPAADPGWGVEISLDLDAVSAACPSCNILLVEGDTPSIYDLGQAVDTAVALGAVAVSNSYGSRGEFSGEEFFDRFYNHPGVAITASSGDYGYGNGLPGIGAVSYPGTSQYVIAVGGTSLYPDSSERGWTEAAWAGSTSGCSAYVHKPGWQKDQLCDKRTVADVAAVADPQTGLAVYDSFGFPGWFVVGGTSLSSPIIASVYAMGGSDVRAARSLYFAPPSSFFDVIGGASGSCNGTYLCTGVPGYDAPTGLGTPNGLAGF